MLSELLNNVLVKAVLLFVGGLLLKRWPVFVNKAIPTVLLVASTLATAVPAIVAAMFPGAAQAAVDSLAVAAHHSSGWVNFGRWLYLTVAPVAFALAAQSGSKNTAEWAQYGWALLHPPHVTR